MAKRIRDYKKEYAEFHAKPEQKKNRAKRNNARRRMERKGAVKKGDGKDVGHQRPLHNGGSNSDSNIKVQSRRANRSEGAAIQNGKKPKKKGRSK